MPALASAAVTATQRDHGSSSSNQQTCTTNSVTPTANTLQLLAIVDTDTATPDTVQSVSGQGLTWVSLGTVVSTSSDQRITLFRSLSGSTSTGTLTITFNDDDSDTASPTGCAWKQIEFAGVETSGTNGSGAIVQVPTPTAYTAASSFTYTFASFASATNAALACYASKASTTTFTAEATYVEAGSEDTYINPTETLGCMWDETASDTSALGTFGSNATAVAIGAEVKEAGAGGTSSKGPLMGVF